MGNFVQVGTFGDGGDCHPGVTASTVSDEASVYVTEPAVSPGLQFTEPAAAPEALTGGEHREWSEGSRGGVEIGRLVDQADTGIKPCFGPRGSMVNSIMDGCQVGCRQDGQSLELDHLPSVRTRSRGGSEF